MITLNSVRKKDRRWMILIIASVSVPAISDMRSDTRSSAVVRDVRAIYEQINGDIAERNAQQIDFAANPDDNNPYEPPDWHIWTDKVQKPDSTVAARIYVIGGNPRKAIVQINSLSGDWVYQTEYYYYDTNGQVAFIFEKNVTSNGYIVKRGAKVPPEGDVFVMEKRSYFDKNGLRIRYLQKAFLLRSGESVPINQIQDVQPSLYLNIGKLPFYKLLRPDVPPGSGSGPPQPLDIKHERLPKPPQNKP